MKKLVLNSDAKVFIKFVTSLGSFVQRVNVSDLMIVKWKDFGLKFDLFILTINDEKWEWVKVVNYEKEEKIEMCSRMLFHGGYWVQTPKYLGRHIKFFTGINDDFPFTCDKICDYLYLISTYMCNPHSNLRYIFNTNEAKNKFDHNFSKHQVTRFEVKKHILGFKFFNSAIDTEYYFDYKNFELAGFLDTLFDEIGNMPLAYIEEIRLLNAGFLSQYALSKQFTVKSDFIVPDLLWIYLIMYKKEIDLHIPHSDSMWKSLMRNQKVSQITLAYQKNNLVTMNESQDSYAIYYDSENVALVNEGYFLLEV